MSTITWRQFNPTKAFFINKMLSFYCYTIDGTGFSDGDYSYAVTSPILNNDATDYSNCISWSDARTQPSFSDLTGNFSAYLNTYMGLATDMDHLHDLYNNYLSHDGHTHAQSDITSLVTDLGAKASTSAVNTALAAKAASSHSHAQTDVSSLVSDLASKAASSHSHAQSDVTGLVAALAAKAEGSGILIKQYSANSTDSNSRVALNLTDTGMSGGVALWNTTTIPSIIILPKKGSSITDPNQIFNACEEVWSNSNKTVSVIVGKGTSTSILLGGTVNSEALVGSGISVDIIVIGLKA